MRADIGFIENFMKAYPKGDMLTSTLEQSIESHVMAFLAEKSRIEGGAPQNVSHYMDYILKF